MCPSAAGAAGQAGGAGSSTANCGASPELVPISVKGYTYDWQGGCYGEFGAAPSSLCVLEKPPPNVKGYHLVCAIDPDGAHSYWLRLPLDAYLCGPGWTVGAPVAGCDGSKPLGAEAQCVLPPGVDGNTKEGCPACPGVDRYCGP